MRKSKIGCVFQRKGKDGKLLSPYYYFKYTWNGQKYGPVSLKTKNKREAEAKADAMTLPLEGRTEIERIELAEAMINSKHQGLLSKETKAYVYCPLSNLVDQFLELECNQTKKDNTIANWRQYQKALVEWIKTSKHNAVFACDVSMVLADDFIKYAKGRWGSSFFNGMLCWYRSVWSKFHAITNSRLLEHNPWMQSDYLPREPRHREILSDEQVSKLMSATQDSELYLCFMLMKDAGMSKCDACGLQWASVNFETGFITYKRKKTGTIATPYMTPALFQLLKERKQSLDANEDRSPCDEMFVSPANQHSYQSRHIDRKIRDAFNAAGIPMSETDENGKKHTVLSAHSFRHGYVSALENSGVSLSVIKSAVGHKNIKTTSGYDHQYLDTIREATSRLGNTVHGSPEVGSKIVEPTMKSEVELFSGLDNESKKLLMLNLKEGETLSDLLKRVLSMKSAKAQTA